jgi:hypothetical protein
LQGRGKGQTAGRGDTKWRCQNWSKVASC